MNASNTSLSSEEINARDLDIYLHYHPRKRNSKTYCEKYHLSRERISKIYQRMVKEKGEVMPAQTRFTGSLPGHKINKEIENFIRKIAKVKGVPLGEIQRDAMLLYYITTTKGEDQDTKEN